MGNFRETLGIDDLSAKNGHIWNALLAEYLGNFFLNFLGCASAVSFSEVPHSTVLKSFTFGLIVFVIIMSLGHVSGAHISTAVTAGMLATGNIPIIKGVLYVVAQSLGGVTGSAVLKALTPESLHGGGLGITLINPKLSPIQGCGVEFLLDFLLLLVVSGICDPNRPDAKPAGPLAIGFTAVLGHLAAIEFTGASMNPARSFGSAAIANNWANHWVYWVGPILGGITGALLYKNAFQAPRVSPLRSIENYTIVGDDEKELRRLDDTKDNDLS